MANYITVDGGTTNTRVHLVRDGEICDAERLSVGAKDGTDTLTVALRNAIASVLERNSMVQKQICRILASGMITSELGICPLPHLPLPVGLQELHGGMVEKHIPEISEIPFCFMRGVIAQGQELSELDMMRGEETELMGILRNARSNALYVLPGSHSKLISVDPHGRMVKFTTMLSGELFAALTKCTILSAAIDPSCTEFDRDFLERGYLHCKEHGINEALFKVRILKNLQGGSAAACYGFLLGVILEGELGAICRAKEPTVVLGGQKQLRAALSHLLSIFSDKQVILLSNEEVEASTARGAIEIFEYGN